MHRIDTATASPDENGPGKDGFTEGDPQIPVAPTKVSGKFLNALQEELCNIVEAAGGTLDDTNHGQVLEAIMSLLIGRNRLDGFTLSNNGTDPTNDIDIATGIGNDSTNAYILASASSMTKRIDAAWVAGTAAGGFPSGGGLLTLTNGTWYRVFAIGKTTDRTAIDFGFDTSATAANLLHASNAGADDFDLYRQIGWIRYGTGTILKFYQVGDDFWFETPIENVNSLSVSNTRTEHTLTIPPDANVIAVLTGYFRESGDRQVVILPERAADIAPSGTVYTFKCISGGGEVDGLSLRLEIPSSANSKITSRWSASGGGAEESYTVLGWRDRRGRQ